MEIEQEHLVLIRQPKAQQQLTVIQTPNSFIKLKRAFITTINYVTKVLSSSLLGHSLVNGIVNKLRSRYYKCLQVYKSRIILLIIINPFVIFLSQQLCFCNNNLISSANTQILIKLLLNNNIIRLITLSRVSPQV